MQKDRIQRIREYIDARGEATVAELMGLCDGCSNMTLWRDLNRLEQEGSIRRTRGGAIAMRLVQPDMEGLYSQRATVHTAEKQAVARAAVELIHPGSALFLDAGSTIMHVAKLLPDQHFTVVTNGANIAIELSRHPHCEVTCIGGQISPTTLSCAGPQAEQFLEGLNIDTAIVAASGFSMESGFSCGNFGECRLKQQVIRKAARIVLVMDSSKVGHNLTFTFAQCEDVDVLVSDAGMPEAEAAAIRAAGTRLILAAAK